MLEIFIVICATVLLFGLIGVTLHLVVEEQFLLAIFFGFLSMLYLAWGLHKLISDSESRPCVKYAYQTQYNPALKISMPMKYCAQYGEWVEE